MSAANKKYQQLGKQVQGWKAKDFLKDKGLELKSKFPQCRGSFDFCPSEDEMKTSLEKKIAPNVCGRCAIFEESGRPMPVEQRKPIVDETFLKAFGKKELL